jgi:hypothetical protein
MHIPVSAKAVLLCSLLGGPGIAQALVTKISEATGGKVKLLNGSTYLGFQNLVKEGLVKQDGDTYSLTEEGAVLADDIRAVFASLGAVDVTVKIKKKKIAAKTKRAAAEG